MRAASVAVLAHGLREPGHLIRLRGEHPMQPLRTLLTRYALVVVLVAVTVGGLAWAGTAWIESRRVPPSVMGPGYNPAPPVIPVS